MTASAQPASPELALRRRRGRSAAPSPFLVWALIGFLALEFLRPPFLQALRLQTVFLVLMPILWLASKQRPWSRALSLQVAFLVTGAIAMPFAHNYYVVYMNVRIMFGFIVTALAVTWLLAYRENYERAQWAWVGMICFQAWWAITHNGRGYGSFAGDENDLALACSMAFPLAFLGAWSFRGAARWMCGALALLLVCGVVASFSRGGFLGLAAGAGYCVLAQRHRVRNISIGVALAAVFFLATPSDYKSEMATIQNTSSGTAETRLFVWTAAARMWLDHPVLGVGPKNATFLLGQYQAGPTRGGMFSGDSFQYRDWSMTALHSIYVELFSERGIVGVVLFVWLAWDFYAGSRRLRQDIQRPRALPPALARRARVYALALEAGMASYLVAGAFLSMLYYPYFWFFTALRVALDRAIRRELVAHTAHAGPAAPAPAEPPRDASQARALLSR